VFQNLCACSFERNLLNNEKKCFYCQSTITKKNGRLKGVQLYKCVACGKPFRIRKSNVNSDILWQEYFTGKQTYAQLFVMGAVDGWRWKERSN
jgi:hypothetical protein